MIELWACVSNPGDCISGAIDNLVALVPWGWVFWSFLAGAVFGAAFGWLGVGAAITAFVAGKLSSIRRTDEFIGEVGDPDHTPNRIGSKYTPRRIKPRTSKRTSPKLPPESLSS